MDEREVVPDQPADARPTAAPLPTALRTAVAVVAAQGVAFAVYAVVDAGWLLATRPRHLGLALSSAVVVLVFATALLALARGLRRRVRAAVAPVVLIELLCLPIAANMLAAGTWWLGVPVGLPALVVLGALFSPAGREVIQR